MIERAECRPAGVPPVLGGQYVVERIVRRSPLGDTVTARSLPSGRSVAVKLLVEPLAGEPWRDRFVHAAEVAMRLSHPNVLRTVEAGVDPRPYVVMDLVEGETLAEGLARGVRLTAGETMTLATHLAAGLAHAHCSGVVHGRLDPDAVVLGVDGIARISDFGFARIVDADGAANDPRACGPAGDVAGLGGVLRQAAGEPLAPGLTALVDAALAYPSVRPSIFDLFHQLVAMTGPSGVWLPAATAARSEALDS